MKFAAAAKEFLAVADELDPGVEPSPELLAHYGSSVAHRFGVEDLHDIEATSSILGSGALVAELTPTQLVVCCLLIGYIAGSKEG